MEQDFAATTDNTSANVDLETLGDQIFKPSTEFQRIDIKALERYWQTVEPTNPYFKEIKSMHAELIDLVIEFGFLDQVAGARKELQENDLRQQPDEADEDILPSRH